MRNPERIPELIGTLQKVWEQRPDLRFFQLVNLVAQWANYPDDPFYCEDDKLLEALKFKLELESNKNEVSST